jgi:hypothetical protein
MLRDRCACTPAVSQCCAIGAHVHTCRVAMLRDRCACAHLPCRNAARSVRTCAPAVSQCCAVGAHVHTYHVATLRDRCARAHLLCRNAARSVRTCAPALSHCYASGAHVRRLRSHHRTRAEQVCTAGAVIPSSTACVSQSVPPASTTRSGRLPRQGSGSTSPRPERLLSGFHQRSSGSTPSRRPCR